MSARQRFVMHRVPEFEGGKVARMAYFGTVTAAKVFAKEQAKRLGHGGYSMESLPANVVAGLLAEHAPIPSHWKGLTR